jgi:hypothetical protein
MYAALFMLVLLSSQAQINAGQTQKADTPVSAGEALLQSAKPSEAREAFEAVLKSNPGDLEARKGEVVASERLALDARQAGHADEALQDLLRAENFAPEEPRLLYDLGILEDEMQLYRDADQTLSTLEQLQPGDPQVMYAVARVKLDLGQLASAEEKMPIMDSDACTNWDCTLTRPALNFNVLLHCRPCKPKPTISWEISPSGRKNLMRPLPISVRPWPAIPNTVVPSPVPGRPTSSKNNTHELKPSLSEP